MTDPRKYPRVHEIDVVAGGDGDAFVHGVVDAFVRFGDPVGQPIGVFFFISTVPSVDPPSIIIYSISWYV